MEEIDITTEFIKLDQFLKWAGISQTGADAKELILEGCVKVNGDTVRQRGKKIYKSDRVIVKDIGEFIVV